jgi:AcrR family transcriptional regulator
VETIESWEDEPIAWPKLATLRIPEPPGDKRSWGNESWEDRYRRQHIELLDVAGRLANELGYERTQISDIVAEARMSKRAFYEHFASKEECFVHLLRRARGAILRGLIIAAEGTMANGAEATFKAMLTSWFTHLRRRPLLYGVIRAGSGEASAISTEAGDGIEQIADIIAVVAKRMGCNLDDESTKSLAIFFAWGAFGIMTPEAVATDHVDHAISALARAMAAGFGLPNVAG